MTTDLAQFLLARLDDIELNAHNAAQGGSGEWVSVFDAGPAQLTDQRTDEIICQVQRDECAWHMSGWSPARVLSQCEADRRIVQIYIDCSSAMDRITREDELVYVGARTAAELAGLTARLLALRYADHPDYRDEWRPSPSAEDS